MSLSPQLTSKAQPKRDVTLRRALTLVTMSALAALSSCDREIEVKPNVLPMAKPVDMAPPVTPDEGTPSGDMGPQVDPCADCLEVDTWYRFDTLALEALDGGPHPVIALLNNFWRTDVNNHVLNVLFEVRAIEGDQVTIGAMNAAWVSEAENDYCLLPSTAIDFIFTRQGCGIINADPAGINIYAGSVEIPKNCSPAGSDAENAIPVRDVILSGEFSSDCSVISNGAVQSAAIKRSALETTCTCLNGDLDGCVGLNPDFSGNNFDECQGCNETYQSLSRQLNAIRQLDWNCEVDGEEAVCIEAGFSATRLDFTPPVCP